MTADELRDFRLRLNITQQTLAEALGVDRNTVARWERGERAIPAFLHLALETIERQKKSSKK